MVDDYGPGKASGGVMARRRPKLQNPNSKLQIYGKS